MVGRGGCVRRDMGRHLPGQAVTSPRRIGPVMLAIETYVRQHPGSSRADVAKALSTDYQTIDRAIRAGLIGYHVTGPPPAPHRLYAAPRGGPGNS